MTRPALLALSGALALAACDSADPEPVPVPLNVQTAADVEADPTSGRDPNTGAPVANDQFTLYDLDTGEVVLSSSEGDPAVRAADSTGTAWDIGLKGTTVILNGGTSGPGSVRGRLLEATPFAGLAEAPAEGYLVDGENECPAVQTPGGSFPGTPYVVCTGSGNGWYTYADGVVTPVPGRTLVLQTSEGDYAKFRVLSYYRGNPSEPGGEGRYYTFEYVVQPDGSRDFDATAAL
ncbi:HmuY family protein [Rubrivirga litoralis]|uniref:HmuY family protein n=1 Tax=Rubrivirga litoralis TaxID=3075598 RepID=A0ABU3BT90_9BACT|nr:HmuY family protein [Rubrivirga sp. F394]MDT0632450.1 HmuY family protein [Rubrivirga sp. F394]